MTYMLPGLVWSSKSLLEGKAYTEDQWTSQSFVGQFDDFEVYGAVVGQLPNAQIRFASLP